MTNKQRGYAAKPFPRNRQLILDAGWIAQRKHMFHGLIEVDVTKPRRFIRQHKARTGESLSFTAFIVACVGHVVDQDKRLHAYRDWRNRLILFDDVDVLIAVEIEIDGHKFPLVHVIRATNRRTLRDIHAEIRAIQADPSRSPEMSFVRFFPFLPTFLRRIVYRLVARSPHLQKKNAGTVGLTNVGMFGNVSGWGFGMPAHTLAITAGSVADKPGLVDGQIESREILNLTLSFDHDIVDGAPAARFTQRLAELIASGYGLIEKPADDRGSLKARAPS
jgi:pyruvate/2-oxoglutarate dehydrogenase complex dihydrolipoamide acyltransferase (E2) component